MTLCNYTNSRELLIKSSLADLQQIPRCVPCKPLVTWLCSATAQAPGAFDPPSLHPVYARLLRLCLLIASPIFGLALFAIQAFPYFTPSCEACQLYARRNKGRF